MVNNWSSCTWHFDVVYFDFRVIDLYHVQIAREVLDAAARMIRPGVTTDEIDKVVHEATIAAGKSSFSFTHSTYEDA